MKYDFFMIHFGLIIKEILSQNIDIKYDMIEISFNLLNDFNYYLSKCDIILDKGKCIE